MTAFPDDIPELTKQLSKFKNFENSSKRLKKYKILEKKQSDRSKSSSNDEFLHSSEIRVCINKNCASDFERAYLQYALLLLCSIDIQNACKLWDNSNFEKVFLRYCGSRYSNEFTT